MTRGEGGGRHIGWGWDAHDENDDAGTDYNAPVEFTICVP